MTTTLIVPDVHEKIGKVKRILLEHRYDKVCFLGDFFDSWDGVTEQTHETIAWLKENLHNPAYSFCWGNHDIQYAYPEVDGLICSGYSRTRQQIVDSMLTRKDWAKFGLFHWVDGFLVSHAGIHPSLLPIGWDLSVTPLLQEVAYTFDRLDRQEVSPLLAAGASRGGWQKYGGITWLDWQEFSPIFTLKQIVGHTEGTEVRRKGYNWCLDTVLNHAALVKGGEVTVIEV